MGISDYFFPTRVGLRFAPLIFPFIIRFVCRNCQTLQPFLQSGTSPDAVDGVSYDVASVKTDPNLAQEITKDETNSATVYIDPEAMKEIKEGFPTVSEAVENVKDIAVKEGWFTPRIDEIVTNAGLAEMNDKQLLEFANAVSMSECSGAQTSWLDFNWLLGSAAYAADTCLVPGFGALTPAEALGCREFLAKLVASRGYTALGQTLKFFAVLDVPITVIGVLVIPTHTGGESYSYDKTLPDGTSVSFIYQGDQIFPYIKIDGNKYNCTFGRQCLDAQGKPTGVVIDRNPNGEITIVQAGQNSNSGSCDKPNQTVDAGGVSPNGGCEPDDEACFENNGNENSNSQEKDNYSKEDQKSIDSYEKRIQEHQQKIEDFKANPSVGPGMENQPQVVIEAQQAARIRHLEREIETFKNNIDKIHAKYQ